MPIPNLRCNEQIRLSPIRLITETGEMRGVVPTDEAMRMAREAGMDLVEVSPNERPPVCKIMDYGKHKYLQSKKLKQKHHDQKTKEVRLRPKTDPHDRAIKLKKARQFLEEGDRVQFTMMFRGRERFHSDTAIEIFDDITRALVDLAKMERPAKTIGRRMTMVLVPTKLPKPTTKPAKKAEGPTKGERPRPAPQPPQEAAAAGTAEEPPTQAVEDRQAAAEQQPTLQTSESA